MPRRPKKIVKKQDRKRGLGESIRRFRIEESYASLFLGFAVVVLIVVLVFSYIGHKNSPTQSVSSTNTVQLTGQQIEQSLSPTSENEPPTVTAIPNPTIVPTKAAVATVTPAPTISIAVQKSVEMGNKMYTVKDGDTLWDISQNVYSSGFLWHQIADANKITDPTSIKPGMVLAIPKINSGQITQNPSSAFVQQSINSDTYTVVHGDTLWDIAVRRYGDGFRWVDIAKLNNLVHPNLIFSGNVLQLPKS